MEDYFDKAVQACQEHAPLMRCRLRKVGNTIEAEVRPSGIILSLEVISPVDADAVWKQLTLGFESQGVIVAKAWGAWEETAGMNEVVPGVFIEDGSVHIIDDIGEVVMWDYQEFEEDSGAASAALYAVAMATAHGPEYVRQTLKKKGTESLSLKWGSLKSWDIHNPETVALVRQWAAIGANISAAMQKDTPEQKELIYKIIDAVDCDKIYLDWDSKYVSKAEAKEYVRTYGKTDITGAS